MEITISKCVEPLIKSINDKMYQTNAIVYKKLTTTLNIKQSSCNSLTMFLFLIGIVIHE